MRNLKKLSRESLKGINGGYRMCPEDGNCGDGFCCGPGGCRSIAGAGLTLIYVALQQVAQK
jgi:hypothetical protein